MTTILVWVLMSYHSHGIVYSPFVMTEKDCQRMAARVPYDGHKSCTQVSIPWPVEGVVKGVR